MEQSPLTPMTRDTMRGLKAEADEKRRIQEEKIRLENIQRIVKKIYTMAIQEAQTTTNTSIQIHSENHVMISGHVGHALPRLDFFVKNIKEIISGLEELFPGCSVRHFTINGTEINRCFQNQRAVITIDWS